mgnify:CR=1 FL=1|jgi:tetratricopeptide (TPR) repeat protein
MTGLKSGHYALLALTGVIIILLWVAPHKFEETQISSNESVNNSEPPKVESQIDSALAIIASEAPMQGILKLRSIAEAHPENFRAQYQLGMLSAQTGQWEKVVERFVIAQNIDPEFAEADYWLGVAKMNLGLPNEAKVHLERFVSNERNKGQLQNEAETMLNQIQ